MDGHGGMVYDDSHLKNVLLKNEIIPCTSEVLGSLWVPNPSPSFHGSASMVNFEDSSTEKPVLTQSDSKILENCYNEDLDDGCFNRPEKKRRLLPEQVNFLEKSFELENKLEPERKIKLAKEVGLQPRQVSIWFQNRRARHRTKQLEKEYGCLKASYDKLKEDSDTLSKYNEKLRNEVQFLSDKLLLKEKGNPKPEQGETISPLNPIPSSNALPMVDNKLEGAASSIKSEIFDSDSPHYTDGYHSPLIDIEPADSSHVLEQDISNFSQDEDDSLNQSLLCFPKLEVECDDDLQPNSCNFGFPVQDQGTWFWQY